MKTRFNDMIIARELRTNGFSFSEISKRIPGVGKGTLSGWLKDIELSPAQKERLLTKVKRAANKGRLKGAFRNHQKRIDSTRDTIDQAKSEVLIKSKNPLFATGFMLYWAEGKKTREETGFTNSDPLMILLMLKWFRLFCNVPESKFRIALNLMSLHDKDETEQYWSKITNVPLHQFNKTIVKSTPLLGKRNPSYMGTCTIRISDKSLFRRIVGWKLGLLESFNIKPQWLNG